jgi:hypothetical protein
VRQAVDDNLSRNIGVTPDSAARRNNRRCEVDCYWLT